jgi:type IV pilus assembly protein PilB
VQQRLQGRVGIYQVMPITDEMQRIIMKNGTRWTSPSRRKSEGVKDLRQSGLIKVKAGLTSLEEVDLGDQRVAERKAP